MTPGASRQRVCSAREVPELGALRVDVVTPAGAVAVAVVRDAAGQLHAISDTCSHQAVSLSEGDVEGSAIECWLHGSTFDLRTGRPGSLPAVHPVPVYALTVDGDDVLVDATTDIGPRADLERAAEPAEKD